MKLTREELRQQLKNGIIAPAYLMYGAETFLRDRAVRYIADKVFSDNDLREFNEDEFSLDSADNLKSAIAAAEQFPMMSKMRVIRVRDIRVSATGAKDTLKEENEELLTTYLKSPAESTVLIFIADELNGTRKISKLLQKFTTAVEFERLNPSGLKAWAREQILEKGSEASGETIGRLVDLAGGELQRLSNEIAKLSAAALPEKRITTELVESLVSDWSEATAFSMTDNLVAGKTQSAIKALIKTLDNGAEPLAILGQLAFQYRRLLVIKDLLNRGASRSEISSSARIFGNQEALFSAARRSGFRELAHALKRISETDLAIKSSIGGGGPIGSRLQLELLVCELSAL